MQTEMVKIKLGATIGITNYNPNYTMNIHIFYGGCGTKLTFGQTGLI